MLPPPPTLLSDRPGLAPAKINLFLHITGHRDDGYHLLESLAVFLPLQEHISIEASSRHLDLRITGPNAAMLPADSSPENLVIRAAQKLKTESKTREGAQLTLHKYLPVAAGIGGGSADAAATFRALNLFWALDYSPEELELLAATLGADIPMCIRSVPCMARGIGTDITPVTNFPSLPLLLVNPNYPVNTLAIYQPGVPAPERTTPPPLPDTCTVLDIAAWLDRYAENDLTEYAIKQAPDIQYCLHKLSVLPDCLLSRMSGSGATCFALFPDEAALQNAATTLARKKPGWWVQPGFTIPSA